ncbi:hypothetical protein [Humibacter ginsenosidimutans]|uniref:Uncharacterized protein n=1 Tax=Humibacter ginsenosidimutans TaxID=2599293 RepID=A0A5B8M3B6_9MICO|nr:hypothetical protein [Humibacter ginsenosidimutans]QDZ14776.1 hypothetical protein FPZ11_08410 [Humibacter ginsenosidimutans]
MDERRRLLERLFSREGAEEEPRDYVDPDTGAALRMTPSQWALAQYDRAHADDGAAGAVAAGSSPAESRTIGEFGDGPSDRLPDRATAGVDGTANADFEDADADPSRQHASRRRHLVVTATAAAVAFVLGALLTAGITGAVGGTSSSASRSTSSEVTAGSGGALANLGPTRAPAAGASMQTAESIKHYFSSYDASLDLPDEITTGFVPGSFHLLDGTPSPNGSTAIYAAQRGDGEYCLVAVSSMARVAETCGNVADIARHGLSLTKDGTDGAGRLLTVTAIWQRDGSLVVDSAPSIG